MADSRHPGHPQPPERPYPGDKQPDVPDEHCRVFRTQKPASLMVWAALGPAGKSPLVFAPGGAKNQQQKLHRDHTWAGAEAWSAEETITGHLSRTRRSEGVSATPRVTPKSGAKKTALHSSPKDQWPPSSPELNHTDYTMWSVLEKEPIPSRTRIFDQWVTEDSRHRLCVPPSETSREGWLPLCGFAATTSSRYLICCYLWSSGNTVKFLRRYMHYVRRYCVLSL